MQSFTRISKQIYGRQIGGLGISIDLDAIDPIDAPGVGTPEPGGLSGVELIESLAQTANHEKLVGLEIAEFNPLLDRDSRTARLIEDLIYASRAKPKEIRHASDL